MTKKILFWILYLPLSIVGLAIAVVSAIGYAIVKFDDAYVDALHSYEEWTFKRK